MISDNLHEWAVLAQSFLGPRSLGVQGSQLYPPKRFRHTRKNESPYYSACAGPYKNGAIGYGKPIQCDDPEKDRF